MTNMLETFEPEATRAGIWDPEKLVFETDMCLASAHMPRFTSTPPSPKHPSMPNLFSNSDNENLVQFIIKLPFAIFVPSYQLPLHATLTQSSLVDTVKGVLADALQACLVDRNASIAVVILPWTKNALIASFKR